MIGANALASKNTAQALIVAGILAFIAYQFIDQQEPKKPSSTY